ncbi:HNH endonuclease signature motif containing protein, partial [Antrihabitans spumae]
RVKVVCTTLTEASTTTIEKIEFLALCAAKILTPGPLRREIWRLWMEADPKEATEAREQSTKTDRTAYVRKGTAGLSWLSAAITDLEGVEADQLLDEIADTVCPEDSRSRNARRADGLMALLHGERSLRCDCRSVDCPTRDVELTPRRGHLAQIVIDAKTLLGLSADPAHLGDGTPIDADLARILAADATWQAILVELRSAAMAAAGQDTDGDSSDSVGDHGDEPTKPAATDPTADQYAGSDCTDDTDDTDTAGGGDGRASSDVTDPRVAAGSPIDDESEVDHDTEHDTDVDSEPVDPEPDSPPAEVEYLHYLRRGRKHRPGAIAHPTTTAPPCLHRARSVGKVIDDILTAIADDASLRRGVHPDGHGGHLEPPPGALIYRPRAEVAELVRAAYPTCVFPNCTVPSRTCELDHRVPFNHPNPAAGGWTIFDNLQPLCKRHHDIKTWQLWTCTALPGGAILWTSPTHTPHITLPSHHAIVGAPQPEPETVESVPTPSYTDPLTAYEANELLYEPTWWETFADTDATATFADHDPYLRDRYREHLAIISKRVGDGKPPWERTPDPAPENAISISHSVGSNALLGISTTAARKVYAIYQKCCAIKEQLLRQVDGRHIGHL